MRTIFCALIVASALVAPALAQSAQDTTNGSVEILRGDYSAAERTLVTQHRQFPDQVDLTLNLATVLAHSGRVSEARALLRDVLARPDEDLDIAGSRTQSSRFLATMGLKRLEGTQITAR